VWPVGARYNADVFALQIEHAGLFYGIGVLAVVVLGVIFFVLVRYSRVLAFSYAWIFMTLAPVHNILLPSWQFQSRYLYLPAVGLCIFLGVVVHKLYDKPGRRSLVRRTLVIVSLATVLSVNCLFLIEYKEKLWRTGQMVRELVSSIKNNASGAPTSTIYFLTFPLSEIDTLNAVYAIAYMHEIAGYALEGRPGKQEYGFAVFIDGSSGAGCDKGTLESDGAFVLSCKGRGGYFFLPKERSAREMEIERIYGVLPPHVMLQPLSPERGTQEAGMASIRMLDADDGSKRVKIRVQLQRDEGKRENVKYVVYENGHFVWQ
jgi:hypothetical protein